MAVVEMLERKMVLLDFSRSLAGDEEMVSCWIISCWMSRVDVFEEEEEPDIDVLSSSLSSLSSLSDLEADCPLDISVSWRVLRRLSEGFLD